MNTPYLILPFLLGCQMSQKPAIAPKIGERDVVYQIFPRSFRDSNGDGHGDFKGIVQGLDAIQKLGCTAILLNPIYKSRVYHNYFADDWFDVDPRFGTLDDFKDLLGQAHKRGIKVILDMEPQYVADGHKWFKAAIADPKSPEAGYLWTPKGDNPFGRSPWYDHAKVNLASVNLDSPDVQAAIKQNFHFWAGLGVDGFRIDHMMDDLDYKGRNKDLYAKLWEPLEKEIKRDFPGTFFVGEQADWGSSRYVYEILYKTDTDAVFGFRLQTALLTFKKGPLEKGIQESRFSTPKGKLQLNFLENHDMARFASEESDGAKQRLAAGLLMSLKGAPTLYYGQEIGMRGRQGHWGTDGNDIPIRLGYRWGKELHAPGTPLWYEGTGPWSSTLYSSDHDGRSLEEQDADPNSLLNWYRLLIRVRRSSDALSIGSEEVIDLPNDQVLGVLRATDHQSVTILANLSGKKQVVKDGVGLPAVDLITGERVNTRASVSLKAWQIRLLERQ